MSLPWGSIPQKTLTSPGEPLKGGDLHSVENKHEVLNFYFMVPNWLSIFFWAEFTKHKKSAANCDCREPFGLIF